MPSVVVRLMTSGKMGEWKIETSCMPCLQTHGLPCTSPEKATAHAMLGTLERMEKSVTHVRQAPTRRLMTMSPVRSVPRENIRI
jgi:hypothetical protein